MLLQVAPGNAHINRATTYREFRIRRDGKGAGEYTALLKKPFDRLWPWFHGIHRSDVPLVASYFQFRTCINFPPPHRYSGQRRPTPHMMWTTIRKHRRVFDSVTLPCDPSETQPYVTRFGTIARLLHPAAIHKMIKITVSLPRFVFLNSAPALRRLNSKHCLHTVRIRLHAQFSYAVNHIIAPGTFINGILPPKSSRDPHRATRWQGFVMFGENRSLRIAVLEIWSSRMAFLKLGDDRTLSVWYRSRLWGMLTVANKQKWMVLWNSRQHIHVWERESYRWHDWRVVAHLRGNSN